MGVQQVLRSNRNAMTREVYTQRAPSLWLLLPSCFVAASALDCRTCGAEGFINSVPVCATNVRPQWGRRKMRGPGRHKLVVILAHS